MNISRMSITNRSDNFSDLSDSFSVLHINSLNSANDIDCVNQIPLVQKPNSQASTSTNSLHVTS